AEIIEFPGCIAEGETAEEAVANLERTAKDWIESELEENHNIPEPASGAEYSGRLALRLPRNLHRRLALMAHRDRTSINQEGVGAVAAWVGAASSHRNIAERLGERTPVLLVVNARPSGFLARSNDAPQWDFPANDTRRWDVLARSNDVWRRTSSSTAEVNP